MSSVDVMCGSEKGSRRSERKRQRTVCERAAYCECGKPEGPGHEHLLPSVYVGESTNKKQQASLNPRDKRLGVGGQGVQSTYRREGIRRNEPLQFLFRDPQLFSDCWEGDRDGSGVRSLGRKKSTPRGHALRKHKALTLIIIAPAHESTKNTLLTVLLLFAGCDGGGLPLP